MNLAPNFSLRKLPPAAAHGVLETEPVFGKRGRHPVSAELDGDGGFSTPGIAFEDFSRMKTVQYKLAPSRKLEVPAWAVNDSALRMLIVRFVERRAGIRELGIGSHTDRLAAAQAKLRSLISRKSDVLDRLCRAYVVEDNPARKRVLQTQIKNLDAVIRTTEQGPALIAGIVYLYYRCGLPSNAVASELGIQPQSVRQILFRLKSTWQGMQKEREALQVLLR